MDENCKQALQGWTETTSTVGPTVRSVFAKSVLMESTCSVLGMVEILRRGVMHNPDTMVCWKREKVKVLNMVMLQSQPGKSDFGDQG